MLTKPIPFQRGHKMYLNLDWPKHEHKSEETKCITTWVEETHPMPARTQNISQLVLNKAIHASNESKWISNCVDQTHPMPARIQNESEHVLTESLPCLRWYKMHFNMCRPNSSHASEDTKCISTCVANTNYACEYIKCIRAWVDQTPQKPVRTKSTSQHV